MFLVLMFRPRGLLIQPGQAVRWVNINCPGQIRRRTIHFLIDKIPPATDGLGNQQARSNDICPLEEILLLRAAIDGKRNRTADDAAKYA